MCYTDFALGWEGVPQIVKRVLRGMGAGNRDAIGASASYDASSVVSSLPDGFALKALVMRLIVARWQDVP
ncbi:MAG: hypothetical protein BWY17_01935 [Deltaproteobacteria bacterium ADurb.Bin207]|jgi:hypothetical protein|nr:MAG: hypothetical protein BWY17_01935 [Deltaproteobacteria bacterium ADurb.Bin207]